MTGMHAHIQQLEAVLQVEIKTLEADANNTAYALVPVGAEKTANKTLKAALVSLLQSVQACHTKLVMLEGAFYTPASKL